MALDQTSPRRSIGAPRTGDAIRFRPGLPSLVVLLAALAAMLLAYSTRPLIRVDVGRPVDAPFLAQGSFNAPEYSPTDPRQTLAWPADSDTLVATGLSPDTRMATITLDAFAPSGEFPRRLIAVYADDARVETLDDRGDERTFRVPIGAAAAQDGTVALRVESILDRYSTEAPPVSAVQAEFAAALTYRWSQGASSVTFPNIGRGEWLLTVRTAVFHPDNSPVNARLSVNGVPLLTLPETGSQLRRMSIPIPASLMESGDLRLDITADTFTDPRQLGVMIEQLSLTPLRPAGPSLPPLRALALGVLAVAAVYLSGRWAGLRDWWAAGAAVVVAGAMAWAFTQYRFPMGFYAQPLTLVLLAGALLTPLLNWCTGWLFEAARLPIGPWVRRILVLAFVVGFWIKAGGLVFPYMRAEDIQWHMDWTRRLMNGEVSFWQLYGINSPMNELTMPVTEWGAERPVIPYSPFFQVFAILFSVFPWRLEITANLLSVLLDCSRVLLIALLGRKAGLTDRGALLAGLIYAVTPVTFLLHVWGNIPTTFGMWLTLVATTIMVVWYERLPERRFFVLLTLVTLACMLFYTVMAAFHLLFVASFALMLWLFRSRIDTRPLRALVLATALAFGLSVLAYYGQYILPVLHRTVPYFVTITTQGTESVGVERPSFGQYMLAFIPHLDYRIWPGDYLYYGLFIPLAFVIPGFIALRRRTVLWCSFAAWFTVALVFMLVGTRISMVDKQLFWIMPPMFICWAVYAERLWNHAIWTRLLVVAVYVFTFVSALNLWYIRIDRVAGL